MSRRRPRGIANAAVGGGRRDRLPTPRRAATRISRACAPTSPACRSKHMAWKVLARGGEPAVRSYSSLAAQPEWLEWSALEGVDTEARLSQLCLWVLESDAAQRPYGLRIPGKEIAPSRRRGASICLLAGARRVRERRNCMNHRSASSMSSSGDLRLPCPGAGWRTSASLPLWVLGIVVALRAASASGWRAAAAARPAARRAGDHRRACHRAAVRALPHLQRSCRRHRAARR